MPAHVIKKVWQVFIFDLAVGLNIKKSSKLNLPHISKAKRFRIENFIQGEWSGVNNGVAAVYNAWGYPSKTSIKDVC